MMMKWTNRYEKKNLLLGKDRRERESTSAMFARSVLVKLVIWKPTCVFTRTRNRMNVMFVIKLFVNLVICKATCVFTRTRNRINVMCARNVLLHLVVWKRTCVLNISSFCKHGWAVYLYTLYPITRALVDAKIPLWTTNNRTQVKCFPFVLPHNSHLSHNRE